MPKFGEEYTRETGRTSETKTAYDAFYEFQDFFVHPDNSPENIVGSLTDFTTLVLNPEPLRGYGGPFVPCTDMVRALLPAAARSIRANPDYIEDFVKTYQDLHAGVREVGVREGFFRGTFRTPAAKIVEHSRSVFTLLADNRYLVNAGFNRADARALIELASSLSDVGIVPEKMWYSHAVRKMTNDPNFDFVEKLSQRLEKYELGSLPGGEKHGAYYRDAYSFIKHTVGGLAHDPSRHRQNSQAVANLIEQDDYTALPTVTSIVSAANKISALLNKTQLLENDGEKLKLEPLDPNDFLSLPAAFGRLLFLTRSRDPEIADHQAHEDRVYVDVLAWIVKTASQKHEQWFANAVLRSLADRKLMYPKASPAELGEISQSGRRIYRSRQFRSGSGRLT